MTGEVFVVIPAGEDLRPAQAVRLYLQQPNGAVVDWEGKLLEWEVWAANSNCKAGFGIAQVMGEELAQLGTYVFWLVVTDRLGKNRTVGRSFWLVE